MSRMKTLEIDCLEIAKALENLNNFGLGYFARLLVEQNPKIAEDLTTLIRLNQEESKTHK